MAFAKQRCTSRGKGAEVNNQQSADFCHAIEECAQGMQHCALGSWPLPAGAGTTSFIIQSVQLGLPGTAG